MWDWSCNRYTSHTQGLIQSVNLELSRCWCHWYRFNCTTSINDSNSEHISPTWGWGVQPSSNIQLFFSSFVDSKIWDYTPKKISVSCGDLSWFQTTSILFSICDGEVHLIPLTSYYVWFKTFFWGRNTVWNNLKSRFQGE